jgi:hypothetical protein
MIEASKELVRVTKKGGTLSIFLFNKCRVAMNKFFGDPSSAIHLLKSKLSHFYYEKKGTWQ